MKTKYILSIIFLVFYPFYLYNMTYMNEKVYSKTIYYDKPVSICYKINGKFLIKKQYEYDKYSLEGAGLYTLYFENADFILARPSLFNKIRYLITKRFRNTLSDEIYIFAKAIFLNEKYDLPNSIKNSFKLLGITHLLAISGLHMSIIYYTIKNLLKFLNYRLQEFIALFIISIYSLTVGFIPSIKRAYIMLLFMILAKLFYESISAKRAYFISLILLLLYNPYQILDLSFIFSYVSTFCILFIPTKNLLLKNIYMQLILTPFTYFYFNKIYIYSFLVNMLSIPLFTILIYLIIINVIFPNMIFYTILEKYYASLFKIMNTIILFT